MAPSIPVPAQGGMFHTFQGITPRKASTDSQDSIKSSGTSASKRITTPHACAECKRRKIRCDGQQPCGQCLSSRAPKRCFYDKHRQRVIPSRKTLEALSQSLEECRSILKRLYPNQEIQSLLPLSRQELLSLLDRPAAIDTSVGGLPSPPLNTTPISDLDSPMMPKSENLLEQMPSRDTEWDEERRGRDPIPAEADDINALSLSVDRQTSYLGASSIKAALMVMLKVQPSLRNSLATPLNSVELSHNYPVIRQKPSSLKDPQRIPWSWKGQTLIDAYFKRIHAFVPMLDESTFRADYLEGQRLDAPWLALLNMVFAMGSIAAMKSDDYNHINYYNRAMEQLPMDALGSSHIETVQALALIGGYYLHYINRPNMANAVLGAAIRMASALGLHRESLAQGASDIAAAETRRRTWWTLFCLDTWATTTMGRPSFGRWGPAINIRPPEFGVNAARESSQHAGSLPLIENIKFCKIATQIQDMLAISPLLRTEDRCGLDSQLLGWYSGLPWLLRTTDPCAEPLYMARCIMKWRYQNLRMLLHRPVLLSLASSGLNPHTQACDADLAAIETCRELAAQTIDDIAREWTRNQMSGWNAVWFLYQAAMVPLVSVFWQWGSPRVPDWLKQIEAVLDLLEVMEEWSLAARRSREVVWRMYEASRAVQAQQVAHRSTSPSMHMTGDGMLISDAGMHMSPIGLEPVDGLGMMGMLDQGGLWDLDGMYWGGQSDDASSADFSFGPSAGSAGATQGIHEGMLHQMDYGMMSQAQAAAAAVAMDGFPYVH
ncbi:fungal-specific transcription factor domain-containing protein [Lasiosphaeria miniovina]|uniref:Fungal-specific transcription factor domain-containing protein n=1 Tax=Lasiosphaeria miniovina TaxID=1954250 RepID=A0AA40AUF2_9PEZI|nr:fungal-specific transcription factor domain-containing protein [Lasiosphaeria miniovina]KAK0722207.1 fungal-specific transcription factor domain-containing protein [Lasiosphaeria miniovina]